MTDLTPIALFLIPEGARLPLAMFLVFGAAKLMAEVFERLRMPGIVGEIAAGILLGQSVLNWIHPSELLTTLSELGVMFLLFRVGLEVKASELLRVGGYGGACCGSRRAGSLPRRLGNSVPLGNAAD